MKPGTFRISLKSGAPYSITSAIDVTDHVVILPTRMPTGQDDATLLAAALYTGVIVNRPSRTSLEGCDPSWWLGTTTGRGVITTAITQTTATLSTWLGAILPFNGISSGTVTNTGTSSHTATYQYVTRREALDMICRIAGAEWRVQPDFTIDAALASTLFRQTDPQIVITPKRAGPDGAVYGMESTMLLGGKDASNLATAAVVVAPSGTATATTTTTYVTPSNGTPDLTMTVDGSGAQNANLSAVASAVLASAGALKTSIDVSTRSYFVPQRLVPGDSVWIYDPVAGLTDAANQIYFQGQAITPLKVRCFAVTWPVQSGMGVYVRRAGATPTYTDITDWVEWEGGDTQLEVGAADIPFDDAAPSLARLGANPDVAELSERRQSFTPTVTQGVGVTCTVAFSEFQRRGNWVDWSFRINMTSAGTAGNDITLSLPVTAASSTFATGTYTYFDAAPGAIHIGNCYLATTTTIVFGKDGQFNGLGTTPNFAVANGDVIHGSITYPV